MAKPRLEVQEINNGRDCVWEVRTWWAEHMTVKEATALYDDVREACGSMCTGKEFVSVSESCKEVCWQCVGKEAAMQVMGCVAEKLGGLSVRIRFERDEVAAEKLWAKYINSGLDMECALNNALALIEELEEQIEQLKGETDNKGEC